MQKGPFVPSDLKFLTYDLDLWPWPVFGQGQSAYIKFQGPSSNGPKVNLLFLQILGENLISTNLDTYSLHTTYNGFKWRGGTCLENGKSNVTICIKFSMNLQSVEKITKWHPKKWRYKIENLMDGLLCLFTCFSIW